MKTSVGTLCLVFLISCFGFVGSHAGWIENGVPLTPQRGVTGGGVIVPDGSSGAIIANQVCQDGVAHIVAQRVNSLGAVLWGDEGIDICTASGGQQSPQITSDGAGGAIMAWIDDRSGTYDIYAQRVNASGAIQWTVNGVPLCTAAGSQANLRIVSDAAGGAIAAWYEYRSGGYDIYAQRVSASGDVQWAADGVALCTATGYEHVPQIASDGAGGAIATWYEPLGGSSYVYAQRVNASGVVQWVANGVALCTATGGQYYPQIASDGVGGAIVTWFDHRSGITYDIYAQRVDSSGAVQWTTDGVAISMGAGDQQNPEIISDGAGGAVITWRDAPTGGPEYDIYAQRVNASGAVQWTVNGVALCKATGDQEPELITSDGAAGAIVAWWDYRGGNWDIYAQRINASGSVEWVTDGVPICSAPGDQYIKSIASDAAGGAIVTWTGGGSSSSLHGQRVDASGAVQWVVNGIALSTAAGDQQSPKIIADGAGGVIATWVDLRGGIYDIYAQRVNGSGGVVWTAEGVGLCLASGIQHSPAITADGGGGAIVTWQDRRNGNYYDIYAQRVDASGVARWTADGVVLCAAAGYQYNVQISSDGMGGAIVTWADSRSGTSNIYVQKVDASGIVQWTTDGVPLCTATGGQYNPTIASDGVGGAIVTWEDLRSGGGRDIYAQRVNSSGSVQWPADGVGVCLAAGGQYTPTISYDGGGGAIVAWQDWRNAYNYDIYAQRVDSSGVFQWTTNGVVLCAAAGDQQNMQISFDDTGGAIVTWADNRSGSLDIYAQRVDASGAVQWVTDGVPLCAATAGQQSPQIASVGEGGAVATWVDARDGNHDIYAQRVDASGAVQWTEGGVALCTATGYQQYPVIASDGAGGAIVAWQDPRCGILIYAQRVRSSGEIVSTLLQDHVAMRTVRGIRVDWSLSEMDDGARFSIVRASAPEWRFIELESAAIEKNGLSFTCTDESCLPGSTYKYRVQYEIEGAASKSLFETDAITIPVLPVTLYQNHPNPFNPQTVIRFYLPETQEILLDVYDVAGERVARLVEGKKEKGFHQVTWDGRNVSGTVCSSGVYFSRLEAGKNTVSRKMVIMR